jgi:hypothetical protein
MKMPVKELGFAVVFGIICTISQTSAASQAGGPLKGLDTDNDGTVDLNETKAAAAIMFDWLDRDHDGTLDRRELRGHLSASELASEDPDHDGTLTKEEFAAAVEKRFKAADHDNDNTLDAREIGSRAGKALKRLVR